MGGRLPNAFQQWPCGHIGKGGRVRRHRRTRRTACSTLLCTTRLRNKGNIRPTRRAQIQNETHQSCRLVLVWACKTKENRKEKEIAAKKKKKKKKMGPKKKKKKKKS